jgi:hypothetical protein
LIRQQTTEQDLGYFIRAEFLVEQELGLIPSDIPEEETVRKHRQELLEFVQSKPRTGLVFAFTNAGERAGLVLVSVSEVREPWASTTPEVTQ